MKQNKDYYYYILSLKYTFDDSNYIVWYRKNTQGYTNNLKYAGKFDKDEVDNNQTYYNNLKSTIAIPVNFITEDSIEHAIRNYSNYIYKWLDKLDILKKYEDITYGD